MPQEQGSTPPQASPWAYFLWLLPVLIATGLLYGVAINGPLFFDDSNITGSENLATFTPPWYDSPSPFSSRPVVAFTFALQHQLHGHWPAGYRAVNILMHLGAALLLWALVYRASGLSSVPEWIRRWRGSIALFLVTLWALHPLHTEAVAYITQRTELMVVLAYLGVMYSALRVFAERDEAQDLARKQDGDTNSGKSQPERVWGIVAVTLCFAGMACKEVMFSAPLAVLLMDRALVSGTFQAAWQRHAKLYAGLLASWALLFALMFMDGRAESVGFHLEVSSLDYLKTQAGAVVMYLRMVFWPFGLSVQHSHEMVTDWSTLPQGLTVLGLLAATFWALVKHPKLGLVAAVLFMVLAPSSSVVPIVTEPIAERRMYLPVACVLLLLVLSGVWAVQQVRRTNGDMLRIGILGAVACSVALFFASATFLRLQDYTTEERIFRAVLEVYPNHPWALNDLGRVLSDKQRYAEAETYLLRGVAEDPDDLDIQAILGYVLVRQAKVREAVPHFVAAVRLERKQATERNQPRDPVHLLNLGRALRELGEREQAIRVYQRVLRIAPGHPLATEILGQLQSEDEGSYRTPTGL